MASQLTPTNVSWNGKDQVVIRSAEIVNGLIQDRDEVLSKMSSQVCPVTLDKIVVDEHGCIIITDAAFKAKIEEWASPLPPGGDATNLNVAYVCGTTMNFSHCGAMEAVVEQ